MEIIYNEVLLPPQIPAVVENGTGDINSQPKIHPIVFIGGGNMAGAMINGCIKNNFSIPENIVIGVKTEKSAEKWRSMGFSNVFTNTQNMMEQYPTANYVICVKPQMFEEVLSIWPVNARPRLIISIMAGIPLSTIRQKLSFLSTNTTIIRLMPNMASCIGESTTSLCFESSVHPEQQEHIQFSKNLAECIGSVEIVPEKSFNAATAVAGSSPAWTFMYIEALADGAVQQGLSRAQAKRMAANAVMGAAKMLLDSDSDFNIETDHMGALKDSVCSPGGTTIEGVRMLEKNGFRSAVMEAVIASSEKANNMSKK